MNSMKSLEAPQSIQLLEFVYHPCYKMTSTDHKNNVWLELNKATKQKWGFGTSNLKETLASPCILNGKNISSFLNVFVSIF